MISFHSSGSWDKTKTFFNRILRGDQYSSLDRYGLAGVDALSRATPRDTGHTAEAWNYKIIRDKNHITIQWFNNNIQNGALIAVLIQYGHGTGTGGYVVGRDYINPAMRPVFDKIADEVWRQVKSS